MLREYMRPSEWAGILDFRPLSGCPSSDVLRAFVDVLQDSDSPTPTSHDVTAFERRFHSEHLDRTASYMIMRGSEAVAVVLVAHRGWISHISGMGIAAAWRRKGIARERVAAGACGSKCSNAIRPPYVYTSRADSSRDGGWSGLPGTRSRLSFLNRFLRSKSTYRLSPALSHARAPPTCRGCSSLRLSMDLVIRRGHMKWTAKRTPSSIPQVHRFRCWP